MKFFNSKYPIVCSPMNPVSDARLAIACHNAGIVPSLVCHSNVGPWHSEFLTEMKKFNDGVDKVTDLLLALSPKLLSDVGSHLMDDILKYNVTHVTFLLDIQPESVQYVKTLREHGIKIVSKRLSPKGDPMFFELYDAIDVKSIDGAARVRGEPSTLMERYHLLQERCPGLPIVVTGGVSRSSEIKQYIDAGAAAVGLGTVFALSEESSIHPEKKLKMIEKSFSDVVRVGINQMNAVVFTEIPDEDGNNTTAMKEGRETPDAGLVFVGKAIDNITSIRSVADIVKELTADL